MADVLDDAERCLVTIEELLDGVEPESNEDNIHAPLAVALLCRMVFLLQAAKELCRGPRGRGASVLLRPAIECWVDCCYVLYCKHEAVLQLSFLGLQHRETLARVWLGDAPLPEISEQLEELRNVTSQAVDRGFTRPEFQLRKRMSVEQRLQAAIEAHQADPRYMNVYDFLYRGISASDVHTTLAIDLHATMTDEKATFHVTPKPVFDPALLVAHATLLACGAATDLLPLLELSIEPLRPAIADLTGSATAAATHLVDREISDDASPELQRALGEMLRRGRRA